MNDLQTESIIKRLNATDKLLAEYGKDMDKLLYRQRNLPILFRKILIAMTSAFIAITSIYKGLFE